MNPEDSDSSDAGSVEELEELGIPVRCLFCERCDPSIEESVSHAKSEHGVEVPALLGAKVRNTYDLVRLVTYVRRHGPTPAQLQAAAQPYPWQADAYLKPDDPQDPWLWTDWDFLNEDQDTEEGSDPPKYVNSENGVVTLSKEHFDQLQKKNLELERLLEEKEAQLDKLRNLLNTENSSGDGARVGESSGYFESYASYDIHYQMLTDSPRMDAFQALFSQKEIFMGKTVLDVGCGTGILSMMAANAGASSVVGVDDSEILYTALDVVAENQLDTKIRLVKSKVEELELEEKFDLLVSEWMGYMLLFEGMLASVVEARDRFLAPGGLVFPREFTVLLCGVSDAGTRAERTRGEFRGYRMSALRSAALLEPSVETVPSDTLCTEHQPVYRIDAMTATKEDCFFESEFTLVSTREAELTGICVWFDADFSPAPVTLTTSPCAPPTHWKQTVLYLERTRVLREGERVSGRLAMEPSRGPRSLRVRLHLPPLTQTFYME